MNGAAQRLCDLYREVVHVHERIYGRAVDLFRKNSASEEDTDRAYLALLQAKIDLAEMEGEGR